MLQRRNVLPVGGCVLRQSVKLVISAAVMPHELYFNAGNDAEFARTASG